MRVLSWRAFWDSSRLLLLRSIFSAGSSSPSACSACTRREKNESTPMNANTTALLYLVAGALFILALRGLSNPETSRRGNLFGMIGIAIAIVTTLVTHPPAGPLAWALVLVGFAVGGGSGAVIARRVPMTSMPELVAA